MLENVMGPMANMGLGQTGNNRTDVNALAGLGIAGLSGLLGKGAQKKMAQLLPLMQMLMSKVGGQGQGGHHGCCPTRPHFGMDPLAMGAMAGGLQGGMAGAFAGGPALGMGATQFGAGAFSFAANFSARPSFLAA